MFVVLEGVDGTGKSSIRQRLYTALGPNRTFTHGKHAWFDLGVARAIIDSRLNKDHKQSGQHLLEAYATDKKLVAQRLTVPALAAGFDVIADRSAISDIVYLHVLHGVPLPTAIDTYASLELPKADVLVLLDADIDVLFQRIAGRSRALAPYGWPQRIDFWESKYYLTKLQMCYRSLSTETMLEFAHRYVYLDTDCGFNATFDKVVDAIR